MARKSRRITPETQINIQTKVQTNTQINAQTNPSILFKTAIYARLSAENSEKDVYNKVIETQINICKNFIDENIDLKLVDIYKDIGISGTSFNRPELNRLLEDISCGKINCIIIKDLSRFSRDYIDAGTYIEQIFPNLNIRFISIIERYDSFKINISSESMIIPLQNLINTLYTKDISRRISTTTSKQMQKGTYKLRNLPYGYIWNEDKTKIIIDTDISKFIKMIFKWKIEGMSIAKIGSSLMQLKVPNPEVRKIEIRNKESKFSSNNSLETIKNTINWNNRTIHHILRNQMYIGNTIFGKTKTASYKNIPLHTTNKDEWIVHRNTHDAIISTENFQIVQNIMDKASLENAENLKNSEKARSLIVDLFKDKIICADCNKKIYLRKRKTKTHSTDKSIFKWISDYVCPTYLKNGKNSCSSHKIPKTDLEKVVLEIIILQFKISSDYKNLLIKLADFNTNLTQSLVDEVIETIILHENQSVEIVMKCSDFYRRMF